MSTEFSKGFLLGGVWAVLFALTLYMSTESGGWPVLVGFVAGVFSVWFWNYGVRTRG